MLGVDGDWLAVERLTPDFESDLAGVDDPGRNSSSIERYTQEGGGGSLARREKFRGCPRFRCRGKLPRLPNQQICRVTDRRDHDNDVGAVAIPAVDLMDYGRQIGACS